MAIDAMDLDSSPVASPEVERKRKHKKQDASSPTKKRKQTDKTKSSKSKTNKDQSTENNNAHPESPFSLTRATLYLPLAPISISPKHALASLQAEHLSPLLLTYYPPLKGIVMGYSNCSISSTPGGSTPRQPTTDQNPEQLTRVRTADEYGVLYTYLTATFLIFRPKRGQTLEGWVNVQSEGFLGAVVFNLFSVGIERKRLPKNWKWVPPGEEESPDGASEAGNATTDDESGRNEAVFDAEKEHFQPTTLAADELDLGLDEESEDVSGHFQSVSGHRVHGNVKFRVVDIDVIAGSERDRGFLSIEGTMLEPAEEEKLALAEHQGQSVPAAIFSGSESSKKFNRVIPISAPAESVEVVDIELEPSEKTEKAEKKDKKAKKEKKEKKEKKSKKEKK